MGALAAEERMTEAEVALQQGYDIHPDALTAKALGHVVGKRDPKKGIKWLDRAVAFYEDGRGLSKPQLASVYHDKAALLGRLPKPKAEKIVALYQEALALEPERASTHESLGVALAVVQRFDEAVLHLRKAARLGRDTPELHSGMAAVDFTEGRIEEAEAGFKRALDLRPGWKEAAANLRAVRDELERRGIVRRADAEPAASKTKKGKGSQRKRDS